MKNNKLSNLNNHSLVYFLIGGFLGLCVFFIIYGVKVINPIYDIWIYEKGGDIVQHYIGWQFYRKTDWQFPIGIMEGISIEPISVMYTDSIPLFAIIFKLLSPILPSTFQYMGIWGIFCFFMQGGFGALIIHKFSKSFYICSVGSLLFTTVTLLFTRMLGHSALAGQWILLIAILLWLYNKEFSYLKRTILWCIISTIAVLVHAYFVPMVLCLMCGALLEDFLDTKHIFKNFIILFASIACIILTMFCLGAFVGDSSFSSGGLGIYSSNLNTFINPIDNMESRFLKPQPVATSGQGEGFAYLGLGVLSGLFIVFLFICNKVSKNGIRSIITYIQNHWHKILPIFIVCSITMFLAVAPVVTLNSHILFTIPYPKFLTQILSIFRASGRFSWVLFYILLVTMIIFILKEVPSNKMISFILTFCVLLQFGDLSTKIEQLYLSFSTEKTYSSPLQDNHWDELGKDFKHIVFLSIPEDYCAQTDMYYAFGAYALKYNMDLSSFVIARGNYDILKAHSDSILKDFSNNMIDEDTIYVLNNPDIDIPNQAIIKEIDNYTICYMP